MFLKEPEKNIHSTNNNGSCHGESNLEGSICREDQAQRGQRNIGENENIKNESHILCDEDGININSNGDCIKIAKTTENDKYLDVCLQNDESPLQNKEKVDYNFNIDVISEDGTDDEDKKDYEPEDIFNYEDSDKSFTSSNGSPADGTYDYDISDSEDSCIQDVNEIGVLRRGIHNPNYPGFQHLAYTLQDYPSEVAETYESTLFSDVYIQCKDEEELIQLSLANQQFNKGNDSNDYDYSDDEGISTKFNDLEDSDCMRDLSSDSAIYENRDLDVSQNDTLLHSSPIPTCEESKMTDTLDAETSDELVSLRHEIYDTLHKPLASTIESVSDVINTVIRHIVEHQSKHETDIWNSLSELNLTNTLESNIELAENLAVATSTQDAEENEFTTSEYDTSSEKLESALEMKDAYMTNVKEELFESPDFEKHICSKTYLYAENKAQSSKCKGLKKKSDITPVCENEIMVTTNNNDSNIMKSPTDPDGENDEKKENNNTCKTAVSSDKRDDQNDGNNTTFSRAGEFDVYNIETAMPHIDLDVIENHLRAAREEERRRRNDREEIRRRLALGGDGDEFYRNGERPGRKPSLQRRLQNGMNLQICFMNETASDTESPSEGETTEGSVYIENESQIANDSPSTYKLKSSTSKKSSKGAVRPSTLPLNNMARPTISTNLTTGVAFFECQARLQTEARMALAQAKELARMQMEIDRSKQNVSPITEMLRNSLLKAGVKLTGDRRRVSRQILTDMNVTQLQVIVNELHTQIEYLNEGLVKYLITRDELHMEQDSMLVDIEDLTRYLSAKQVLIKNTDDSEEEKQSTRSTISSLLNK